MGGQAMATLSPTTRWEIRNTSGVRGELWAEEWHAGHGRELEWLQASWTGVPKG